MDSKLLELQEIISNNRDYTFDFAQNTVIFKSRILKILLWIFIPMVIVINIEMALLFDLGTVPTLITAIIPLICIAVIVIRAQDFLKINFIDKTIEKKNFLKIQKVNFNEIQHLNIVRFSPRSTFSTVYFIEAQKGNEKISLLGNKSESKCIEIMNWLNKYYFKQD